MRGLRVAGALGVGIALAVSGVVNAGASDAPFTVVHNSKLVAAKADVAKLYQEGEAVLLRNADAEDADFNDLYVVKTPEWFAVPESVVKTGQLVAFIPTKFAVMRIPGKRIEEASVLLHESGLACGGLFRLNGDEVKDTQPLAPVPMIPIELRDDRVVELAADVISDRIRTTVMELTEFTTRFHSSTTGRGVPEFLQAKYEELAAGREDVTISLYDHGSQTSQKSLVVRIEGQTRPAEMMVLGSHIDSVNWSDGSSQRAPGADDNASGTATNLEIFRILMESGFRLERTLEIHGYAAEEIGLVGSQDMAADYKAAGVNVIAMVQHDMNLWKAQGAPDKIWFVTSNTQDDFNSQLGVLVDKYVGLPWEKAPLSGGSSDHASWRRQGYATAFPFENPRSYNRHIHTRDDTIANAGSFEQAAGFAKLGLAYVAHFAGIQ